MPDPCAAPSPPCCCSPPPCGPPIWGKGKLWQHTLTLLAAKGSDRSKAWRAGAPTLPAGKYLVKVYVDAADRLAKDWAAELGEADYAGQAVVETRWSDGYGKMTSVPANRVARE